MFILCTEFQYFPHDWIHVKYIFNMIIIFLKNNAIMMIY